MADSSFVAYLHSMPLLAAYPLPIILARVISITLREATSPGIVSPRTHVIFIDYDINVVKRRTS
jgi:hypothetical protein